MKTKQKAKQRREFCHYQSGGLGVGVRVVTSANSLGGAKDCSTWNLNYRIVSDPGLG